MIKLYTDAATKGNPGPSGIGILIITDGDQLQKHRALPEMSNHQAEFEAAIAGFSALTAAGLSGLVSYYSDSKIVIDAINKAYAKHYGAEIARLLDAMAPFTVFAQWVPDKENSAHGLAQQGLREA
ncbi:ribonuclease HI family protein [Lacticaseibacillus mingshuiensis]|uniref:Ribonuclease HI family protein n=1 Tax=Lacticaseibacillus mingshuiensis TaxID=2799574 RepID=A0ABW4CGU0_9LACO|nr:ribonuclease HI family protein [Lacticaseibacillus mingshuiensis]